MLNLLANNGSGAGIIVTLLYLALAVLMIVIMWKVNEKAGYPGIACIIPIYNIYVMVKIAGYDGIYMLLYFIPLVNVIFSIMVAVRTAEKFGKSSGFALGLIFLAPIFYGILAFDDSVYTA